MASFTDTSLQPYNPYVAQLPIEAMVSVGTQKQNQYEQGIQKIQGQIDQVAGMDVVRDVDKQYLQSKLNGLKTNLNKVAAGDFSNFQLQNSVGGMISNISKDSTVQNAVASTMRYRKGVADMEAAKKEGKSSPSNEWDFMNQASGWLNNKDVKSSFSGGYNPYTNYKKNALDTIKGLTKDESITDDAFTLDNKGNLVIADATVRKKLAGISPQKIQQALMAGLSPADFKQMEIDGRYNYSNVSPQQFMSDINSSYKDKVGFYTSQRETLKNAKSSTTSTSEKVKLDEQIAAIDKTIAGISQENKSMMSAIQGGNIEGVKAQLHTNNFMDNFSKAFSFTETSQTYETSPLAQIAMQRANKEQDWKKFLLQMDWDKEKFALDFSQKERLASQKAGAKGSPSGTYGGVAAPIKQEDVPQYTLDRVIGDTVQDDIDIARGDETFIRTQHKDQEWFDAQRLAWEKSPNAVDPKIADHFSKTEDKRRTVDANKAMISDINKQAEAQFGTIDQYIPDEEGPTILDDYSGSYINFTPKDIVSYNSKSDRFIDRKVDSRGKLSISFDDKKAQKELSPKEYKLYQAFKNNKTSQDKTLIKSIQDYGERVNLPYKSKLAEIQKFTADEVTKRITHNQGVTYSPSNDYDIESMANAVNEFANLAEKQGGLANSDNFDIELARKISIEPSAKFTMSVVEGTPYQEPMYEISATGKEGSTSFRISGEQKTQRFGDLFEASPEVQAFRPYQQQITKMGGYTTSLQGGPSTHDNAFLTKVDFPSVQHYGVKANIEQPSPGKYSIRISAFDPVKRDWYDDIPYPRSYMIQENEVVPLMMRLNDAAIFELLTDRAPGADELKQIEKASKKPL